MWTLRINRRAKDGWRHCSPHIPPRSPLPTTANHPQEFLLPLVSFFLAFHDPVKVPDATPSIALSEAYPPRMVEKSLDYIQLVRLHLAGRPGAYDQVFKALKLYEEDR